LPKFPACVLAAEWTGAFLQFYLAINLHSDNLKLYSAFCSCCLDCPAFKNRKCKSRGIINHWKTISADEAKAIGLINEVYEDKSALERSVEEFIKNQLLPKSASSLRYAAKAARTIFNQAIKEKLQILESIYTTQLMETLDANEGINSFLEKRKPIWQNK
jgi:1,4-dihydroxy-2-naphthoyl-CoA synthase